MSVKEIRILIIDDDEDIRQVLYRKLIKQGYEVLLAEDGEHGLDRLQTEWPDMVIVDVNMPGMDGFEFCERAASVSSKKHIPIIIMTAQDDQVSVNKAYEKGATDFITKPINHAKLMHRLRFCLRSSQIAQDLAKRERQLRSAQSVAKMGEWTYDTEKKHFQYSNEVAKIFGVEDQVMLSYEDMMKMVVDSHAGSLDSILENTVPDKKYHALEYTINSGDGNSKRIRQIIDISVNDPLMQGKLFGIFQDVSDLRNAEQQVKNLSFYDGLTGLPNRRFFKRLLDKTIATSKRHDRRFALLDINFDNFNRINTNLGHTIGDKLLIAASERLKETIRDSDELFSKNEDDESSIGLLAHMGGDDFIILLNDIKSADDAAIVAQRIQSAFTQPFSMHQDGVHISVSIGIGIYPDDGADTDMLLKNICTALYNAKQTGRNCYRFYTEAMNTKAFQRLSLEISLRKAIELKQFELYYQPKISLVDGNICGAEALIRWNHPEMGIISPGDFIPIAETTGLIVPLTDWVIMEACRQLGDWRRNGISLSSVAVNITPASLLDKNINEHVFRNLQLAGVEASHLDFEITESVLMEDVDIILPLLKELRDFGVSISIDDFGTGYSSLSYLKRLPISKLKIDQSFIRDLLTDKDDAVIVNTVISLAHNLGLRVIAEGVEELEQLEYLKKQGCDVVQGYYYSRPLPADKFSYWVREYESELAAADKIRMLG